MEIDNCMLKEVENHYLTFETPFPDDFLLRNCIRETMSNIASQELLVFESPVVKKSEKTSIVCCIMGEKALANNENNEALKAFTNALCLTPVPSKMIAHCYFWRSVALQKLKAYTESMKDIERALKLKITEDQKNNLLNRKKVLEDMLLKQSKKEKNNKESNQEDETLSYGENEQIKGVSSAMTLVYNEKFGRHFVATRDIQIGDFLMIQSPLTWAKLQDGEDNPKGKKWMCDYCLHSTKCPIACENCTYCLYCSFTCRSAAFKKYHEIECKVSNVKSPLGPQTTLFLRTLLVATNQGENFKEVGILMEKIKNCKDKKTAAFKDGKLDGRSANAVLGLLHHMEKQQLSGLVYQSAHIATALKKHTDFLKGNDPNDVYKLGRLLVFLSYICHMNLYCIRRKNFYDRIAFGMYPVFNYLNHSCACNTLSYDDKQRNKILRACKNIKKGEQIFVTYNTFDVMQMKAEERKEFLLTNKFFTCQCEICERNYSYKPELIGSFKVPAQLKRRLRKKPKDTESLWTLLKRVLSHYKHPCLEAKMIEMALVNAHLGHPNKDIYQVLKEMCVL